MKMAIVVLIIMKKNLALAPSHVTASLQEVSREAPRKPPRIFLPLLLPPSSRRAYRTPGAAQTHGLLASSLMPFGRRSPRAARRGGGGAEEEPGRLAVQVKVQGMEEKRGAGEGGKGEGRGRKEREEEGMGRREEGEEGGRERGVRGRRREGEEGVKGRREGGTTTGWKKRTGGGNEGRRDEEQKFGMKEKEKGRERERRKLKGERERRGVDKKMQKREK